MREELADKIYEAPKTYRCLYIHVDGSGAPLLDVLTWPTGSRTVEDADTELSELSAHIADELSDLRTQLAAKDREIAELKRDVGSQKNNVTFWHGEQIKVKKQLSTAITNTRQECAEVARNFIGTDYPECARDIAEAILALPTTPPTEQKGNERAE